MKKSKNWLIKSTRAVFKLYESFIHKTIAQLLVIVFVGLIGYSNTFSVPFQFDDEHQIQENPVIKNIHNLGQSFEGHNSRRYIGYMSFALNYSLGGLDVTGYHILNLAIHVLNGILVYFLLLFTYRTPFFRGQGNWDSGSGATNQVVYSGAHVISNQSRVTAFIIALLFVSHPVQTQAVTYIVQRFTSLATMFYLLSVVMYIKGRLLAISYQHSANGIRQLTIHDSRFIAAAWFILSFAAAVLAMNTKEIAFTLPFMLLLYEFTFFTTSRKKKLLLLVSVLLTIVIIALSVLQIDKPLGEMLSDLDEKARQQTDMPRGDYLMTQMRVVVTYIRLLFLPVNQNFDYDYPIYHSFLDPPVFLSFLFLSTIFAGALYLVYKSRHSAKSIEYGVKNSMSLAVYPMPYAPGTLRLIAFGILWFFLALSIESSFIPIVDIIFEHRVYLPSIGFFISIGAIYQFFAMWLEYNKSSLEKALFPVALFLICILSAATFARNSIWVNNVSLWEDTVKKSPYKVRPHINLGEAYLLQGRYKDAINQFQVSLNINPYFDSIQYYNLGWAYAAQGRFDDAIKMYRLSLNLGPDAKTHTAMGVAYEKKGFLDDSIKHFERALVLQPQYPLGHYNLGLAYAKKGLAEKAIEHYQIALGLNFTTPNVYHNLGLAYFKKGWIDKAIETYHIALNMDPTHAHAHYNLGKAYKQKGLIDQAITQFEAAVNLEPYNDDFRNDLSDAYQLK